MPNKYRPNVIAVITQNDKFLIQHNPRFNHWQFPQGGVDQGETPEQAVVREASEELGVEPQFLTVKEKLPEQYRYDWPKKILKLKYYEAEGYIGQEQTIFILTFSGTDNDFHLDQSDELEADDFKWVTKDELKKYIHTQRHGSLEIILKYIE